MPQGRNVDAENESTVDRPNNDVDFNSLKWNILLHICYTGKKEEDILTCVQQIHLFHKGIISCFCYVFVYIYTLSKKATPLACYNW